MSEPIAIVLPDAINVALTAAGDAAVRCGASVTFNDDERRAVVEPAARDAMAAAGHDLRKAIRSEIDSMLAGLDAGCAMANCLEHATHIEYGASTSVGLRTILTCANHADEGATPLPA